MSKFLHVLRAASLKKALAKVPVSTLQQGLGCPARASEPGATGASERTVWQDSSQETWKGPGMAAWVGDSPMIAGRVWSNKTDSRSGQEIKSMCWSLGLAEWGTCSSRGMAVA